MKSRLAMRAVILSALLCVATGIAIGCGEDVEEPATVEGEPLDPEAGEGEGEGDETAEAEPEEEAEPVDTGPPKRIFAKRFVVPVRAAPSREAERIGYLRAGAVLMAKTSAPVGNERCRGGWYELTTGGFVCNGRHVIAFEGERLPERRSRQPSREDVLPYEYGFIRRRAPMYRRLPSQEEAAKVEGFRIPGREMETVDQGTAAEMVSEMAAMAAMAEGADMSAMTAMTGDGAMAEMSAMTEMAAAMRVDPEPAAGETGTNLETSDEEDEGPTLATLAVEDRESVLMRWMMRGFFVSLDRDFRRHGRRYWRTQSNGFVPWGAVVERSGSEFAGVTIPAADATDAPTEEPGEEEAETDPEDEGAEEGSEDDTPMVVAPRLPYAWTLSSQVGAYQRAANGSFRRARGRVEYHEGFVVVAEETFRDRLYLQAADGRWFRDRDVRVARLQSRPSRLPDDTHKWLDIDLSQQTLVAYEGETPVFATLISSGKPDRRENAEETWETLSGVFHVKSKHLTDTMDGDTVIDGPYSVDDVPYVMYFELAYALHSAFWHNGFGRPRSHGCVNLSPTDARHVFNWADPPLPEGWHSVYPEEGGLRTGIYVHGETARR